MTGHEIVAKDGRFGPYVTEILPEENGNKKVKPRTGSLFKSMTIADITLDDALIVAEEPDQDFVALDEALTALAAVDARNSQVVELRFFGGLTLEETAEALQVSRDTVKRDWKAARAWLAARLQ